MNILGKAKIYKNDYGYSTAISNKNQNGEYENMYVSIQLPKGVELENKTMIEITKGFLTFYKNKEGLPKLKIVVMEYNIDADKQYAQEEREAIQNEEYYSCNNEPLLF